MNAEKFTQKAMEALQDARTAAIDRDNTEITPEHLLYALVEQEDVQAFLDILQAEGLFTEEFYQVIAKMENLPDNLDAIA